MPFKGPSTKTCPSSELIGKDRCNYNYVLSCTRGQTYLNITHYCPFYHLFCAVILLFYWTYGTSLSHQKGMDCHMHFVSITHVLHYILVQGVEGLRNYWMRIGLIHHYNTFQWWSVLPSHRIVLLVEPRSGCETIILRLCVCLYVCLGVCPSARSKSISIQRISFKFYMRVDTPLSYVVFRALEHCVRSQTTLVSPPNLKNAIAP